MEYLIYTSKALVAPGSAACRDIVASSERSNATFGLTGFLHAEEGLFIQYLEGAPDRLWTLYKRLHLDTRHKDLVLLGHGEITQPRFQDWSLGYSENSVLSFSDFVADVSFFNPVEHTSGMQAIYFLMAASARIDLGIADLPQSAWH
jgi:hypothetical protein